MNTYTLKFKDVQSEKMYNEERFQIEVYIVKRMQLILLFVGFIFSANTMIFSQNYESGGLSLAATIMVVPCFWLSRQKPLYLDIFTMLIQILINSALPVMNYMKIGFSSEEQYPEFQYQRATLICYFSFSLLVGSKYYLKSIIFAYTVIMQIILEVLQGYPFSYPTKSTLIIAGLAVMFYCYESELCMRRYFLQKQQQIIFNKNIMQSFKVPLVCCQIVKGILVMKEINQTAQDLLSIHNQRDFILFLQNYKTDGTNLQLLAHKLLESTDVREDVVKAKGMHYNLKYICNISFYVEENAHKLLLNFQKCIEANLEQQLLSKIRICKQSIQHIQHQFINFIRQNNGLNQQVVQLGKQFQIEFYSILNQFVKVEPSRIVNIDKILRQLHFITDKHTLHFRIDEQCRELYSVESQVFLLLSKLILLSVNNCQLGPNNVIILRMNILQDEFLGIDLIKITIQYIGLKISKYDLQLLQVILHNIGADQHIECFKENKFVNYRLKIVKDLRQFRIRL